MKNLPLYGKELNEKHRVYDDILTPEEIVAGGLIYVPSFPYIHDGVIIQGGVRKLRYRTFNHNWTDEEKKLAKEEIIKELKHFGLIFVKNLFLTPFADQYDYSNCCYSIGILALSGRKIN
jgi:hypothetical protein